MFPFNPGVMSHRTETSSALSRDNFVHNIYTKRTLWNEMESCSTGSEGKCPTERESLKEARAPLGPPFQVGTSAPLGHLLSPQRPRGEGGERMGEKMGKRMGRKAVPAHG